MSNNRHPFAMGFTILELMVAMSITVLMLFLINRLFLDTVNAVSQGAALSQVLPGSRAISDHLVRDAEAMIGPADDGILIIVNQVIGDTDNDGQFDPGEGVPCLLPDGTEVNRLVRSDQLIFIRDAARIDPVAPRSADNFASSSNAPYARIWYGHLLRTNQDGSPPSGGLGTDPNRLCNNWILGRQALFLQDDPSYIGTDDVLPSGAVVGYGTQINPAIPAELRMGLTDVAWYSFNNPLSSNPLLVGPTGALFEDSMTYFNYRLRARSLTFYDQRLHVNPHPTGTTFQSAQIAQMHPYLVENVSDFVVEFAIDLDNNGEVDTYGYGGPLDPDNTIRWYGLNDPPSYPAINEQPKYEINPGMPNPTIWFFRHDYAPFWPHLIRIRYRLHDRHGRFQGERQYTSDHTDPQWAAHRSGQWFEQIIKVNRQ